MCALLFLGREEKKNFSTNAVSSSTAAGGKVSPSLKVDFFILQPIGKKKKRKINWINFFSQFTKRRRVKNK